MASLAEGPDPASSESQSIDRPGKSGIGALPIEIQFSILDVLIGQYHNAEGDGYKYASAVLKFLFVCKTWYSYASRQIYKRIYFGRAFQYFKLARHLQSKKGKGIRKLVKKVVFELHENQGAREVLDSYVIQTIFKLCRRIRTVDLRCKWVEVPQHTPWNGMIAEAMKVYADPIRFIYNDPASSPFTYADTLLETNLLSFMKNLQRLDLYIDPNPVKLARKLAQIPVPHMNIRVYLQTDDDGDVDYTPENELATLDPNAHIVRPHTFFKIVVTNEHLRKLEISSRQYEKTPKTHFSKSEQDIIKWINKTDFGPMKVEIYREYPSLDRSYLMGTKTGKWERGLTKKWLDQYQVSYNLLYDHESDEDPSDSEWEQDTHLETRVSNRTALISPPVSQLGDDL